MIYGKLTSPCTYKRAWGSLLPGIRVTLEESKCYHDIITDHRFLKQYQWCFSNTLFLNFDFMITFLYRCYNDFHINLTIHRQVLEKLLQKRTIEQRTHWRSISHWSWMDSVWNSLMPSNSPYPKMFAFFFSSFSFSIHVLIAFCLPLLNLLKENK